MSSDFTPPDQQASMQTVIGSADSQLEATYIDQDSASDQNSRQRERDLAFAVAAIEAGFLTHKQLAGFVKDWTIHGDLPLSEHLISKAGLTPEDCRPIEDTAELKLQRAQSRVLSDVHSSSLSATDLLIKHLDQHGKIASCLGLTFSDIDNLDSPTRGTWTEFRLLKKLGQGGLGVVWLARDESLKRLVAIKEILRKSDDDSPEVRRFRREAEITGRLEHPSIVPIHQFGTDSESEQPFYVMRYIGKRTLENAIDEFHERRLAGEKDLLQLHYLLTSFVSICQAIAYAHSKNVIHRDLKPENVVLDNYGQVIVLDWGLAKLTGDLELIETCENSLGPAGSVIAQTQDGQVLGTPMYMSPEQATGRLDEINERTDVYGLGAILFAILTGFAPHEKTRESSSANTTMSELLRSIVSEEPPPARSINPDAPPELEAICAKSLSIKAYSRYGSAAELAEDVQRWMAGESVSAYQEPWKKRAVRWIANHSLLSQFFAASATILIVSAVTLGLATQNALETERQTRFEQMKSQSQQLAAKVESRAEDMIKNVRFMSALPPIHGIMIARSENATDEEESEEVWVKRLQNIYTGLLEANPHYLSVSLLTVDPATDTSQTLKQVVRVERRRTSGSLIRTVPTTRLNAIEETPALKIIRDLQPGEVYLEEHSLTEIDGSPSASRSIVFGGTPVYQEETGELFGIVTVETDLETNLRDLMGSFVPQNQEAYVVTSNHRILLHVDSKGDFQAATRGQSHESLPKEVRNYLLDKKAPDTFSDGKSLIARKIRLNETPDSDWLCFVLVAE